MQHWHVYIVRCRDGSLYTGIAIDVQRRLSEHQDNKGAKYLRGRGPVELVFEKKVGSKSAALKLEREIKQLPKRKKEAFVKSGYQD